MLLNDLPDGFHCGVRDEHLDDGATLDCPFDIKQRFAGLPSVFDGAVPILLEGFGLADDDVDAVVLHVQCLGRALHAVADDRDGFLLENTTGFAQGKLFAHNDCFFNSAKIDYCHLDVSC